GGTYSITAAPVTQKFPKPEYRVRIEWTCDPARTATLVRRVFDEIASLKARPLSRGQVALVHDSLLQEFEKNSQDNGYLLNQISGRYEDSGGADVAALDHMPERIAALTGDAIQLAARTYLNTDNYVRVTLMPETK